MMERRGEGGVGEPTQLCKDLITAQVSTTWTRSSGMKRCCDMRLPSKRKRQHSFATSSSQEEKVAPVLLRNRSFSHRLFGQQCSLIKPIIAASPCAISGRSTGTSVQLEPEASSFPMDKTLFRDGNKVTFENLEIATPSGCTMLSEQYVQIALGERVVIVGAPGTGKTLLFRAIAGLWPWGSGRVALPS